MLRYSSVVERPALARMDAGSSPAAGAFFIPFYVLQHIAILLQLLHAG